MNKKAQRLTGFEPVDCCSSGVSSTAVPQQLRSKSNMLQSKFPSLANTAQRRHNLSLMRKSQCVIFVVILFTMNALKRGRGWPIFLKALWKSSTKSAWPGKRKFFDVCCFSARCIGFQVLCSDWEEALWKKKVFSSKARSLRKLFV